MTIHQSYLRTGFKVLNGADPTAVYAFMAGATGAIWGAANFMPRECVALWQLVRQQRHAHALALWQTMLPSLLIIWNDRYVPTVLRAAQLRGFGTGRVRKPLRALSAAEDAALRTALDRLDGAPLP
jgi:4-hydroxy-tetrahydrodipicolinate synthase